MRQNLSSSERALRLAIGVPAAILVSLAAGITSVAGILAMVFGVSMAISAMTGYSPLFDLLEIGGDEPAA